jgi:2-C-methyl-D-erythritol 4-phosphate cytidylyltransferase
MGGTVPKQFIRIGGTEILVWTVGKFLRALGNPEIMVVLPPDEIERWVGIAARNGLAGLHKVCAGGNNRFESVRNGIEALGECRCRYIAVHDGVRPLLSEQMIKRCVSHAVKNGSAVPVTEPVDSFRIMDGSELKPIARAQLRSVQTPQIFDADTLRRAYRADYSPAFTDDATVVESIGGQLSFCEGERSNIKITAHDDLVFAEALIDYELRTAAKPREEAAS